MGVQTVPVNTPWKPVGVERPREVSSPVARAYAPVPETMVVYGEIGLSGEIRAVTQGDQRLKEAAKLGFTEALVPPRRGKRGAWPEAMRVREVGHLQDLVALLAPAAGRRREETS